MASKTTPFEDDFSDKDISGWGVWSGTWEVGVLPPFELTETGTGGGQIVLAHTDADNEIRFSYVDRDTSSDTPVASVAFRHDSANERAWLAIRGGRMGIAQTDDGTNSTLVNDLSVDSLEDVWYDMRIVADGPNVDVYRREKDSDDPWTQILSVNNCTVTTTSRIWMNVNGAADFGFDYFFVLSDGLSNTTTFTYNGANELVSSTDYNFTTNYAYDEFGRLTGTTTVGGGPFTDYAYDYDDRLVEVAPNGQPPVTYQYGGDGLLRTRTHNGETTTLNWTGISVSSEEDAAGNIVRSYVGRSLAHIDGANPSTGDYRYYAHDHLYNTRALFDGAKANTSSYEFAPYGELLSPYANETNRLYTGHRLDEDTAQYLTAYRWYDPTRARWHVEEPLGFIGGPNLYAYANNAPTVYWDPDGRLAAPVVLGFAGFVVGGIIGAADQLGCGAGSMAKGFGIGGVAGAVGGAAAAFGPIPGMVFGAAAGAADAHYRGDDPVVGGVGGAIGGAMGGLGAKYFKPSGNLAGDLVDGVTTVGAVPGMAGAGSALDRWRTDVYPRRPGKNCL